MFIFYEIYDESNWDGVAIIIKYNWYCFFKNRLDFSGEIKIACSIGKPL